MKKKLRLILMVCILISAMGSQAPALEQDKWTGNVNLIYGSKQLNEDDWKPIEKHQEYSLEIDLKHHNWPISGTMGFSVSGAYDYHTVEDFNIGGITSESYIGIRKIWEPTSKIRPFIGAGLCRISAEVEAAVPGIKVSDKDNGTGMWYGGGVFITLSKHFNIGFNWRHSSAEVNLFNVGVEAGGTHTGLTTGYHWNF